MTPAAQAWDLLVQGINVRDAKIKEAIKRVEREWVGTIELRRAAFMAAIEREKVGG